MVNDCGASWIFSPVVSFSDVSGYTILISLNIGDDGWLAILRPSQKKKKKKIPAYSGLDSGTARSVGLLKYSGGVPIYEICVCLCVCVGGGVVI